MCVCVDVFREGFDDALQCLYWDDAAGAWSAQGLVLLGYDVTNGTASVLCGTLHFTMFTIGSQSKGA